MKSAHRFFNGLLAALFVLLMFSLIARHPMLPDVVFSIIVAVGLKWFTHEKIGMGARVLIVLAILASIAGTLGLYAHFAIGFIGYDKIVHFVSGMAIAAVCLSSLRESFPQRYVIVLLVVLGAGAVIELSEFVGTRYFDINNGGILAMNDNLPIVSDLQKYDTYFDLATSLLGSIITCIIFLPRKRK